MDSILVVDPEAGLAATLAVALRRGFRVHTASTATRALPRLGLVAPSVALVDAQLSTTEDVWFLERLRAQCPSCRIVLTSGCPRLVGRDLAGLGIDGLVVKPCTIASLIRQIDARLASSPEASRVPTRFGRHVGSAIEHVRGHYAEALTVSRIAAAVRVSPSRLAHAFKAETAMTVKAFVDRVRIEVASRYLTENEDKLESVAALLGFCDASHLSRVFHRLTGQWPGRYRAENISPRSCESRNIQPNSRTVH